MSPEAQRVAIATACGWTNQGRAKRVPALENRWLSPHIKNHFLSTEQLPDYLSDLNAMHEAEKVLTPAQQAQYAMTLHEWHGTPLATFWHRVICSTAAQRAEAFLRTLNLYDPTK